MKRDILALLLALTCTCAYAQGGIYSIVTCPGEDTRTGMSISWASDSDGSYVEYSAAGRRPMWKRVVADSHFCEVYDSLYSKRPDGSDFYESARFWKCGAVLTGLKPRTDYVYRVISGRDTSAVHSFRTSGRGRWSACIISDFHLYPPIPGRQRAAMDMMKSVGYYDWVLHVGDVCAWGGSWSFWRELYADEEFLGYMWAGVNGNHDNMSRRYELTNDYFRNANHYPSNGYEGEEGVCYWFRYGDALFIMLNSESMRSDEGLAAAQDWVRQIVAANPDVRWKVVCEHYQWFFGESGKDSQYGRWREVFDELGINLAIGGNNHIYVRTCPLYGDKPVGPGQGTVYVQTSSSDNDRGSEAPDPLSENMDKIRFRWTEGTHTVSALRLDVNRRRMKLVLLNREGSILDEVVVR